MKNEGFTLVELLAVILILSFIAIIAVPIVLNIITEAKIKSLKISTSEYIRAVNTSLINEEVFNNVSDGLYTITDNGKKIVLGDKEIFINYDGRGLKSGLLLIENSKVTRVLKGLIDDYYARVTDEDIEILKNLNESTLVSGQDFNKKVKELVGDTKDDGSTPDYNTIDTKVKKMIFLQDSVLPEGLTKEELEELEYTDLSSKSDGSIKGYYDDKTGTIYVYSDGYISCPADIRTFFTNFQKAEQIELNLIDTSKVTIMIWMFNNCNLLKNINLIGINTSSVTDIGGMFSGCSSLKELDLSNFNTSSARSIGDMFRDCINLKEIKGIENFDTSNVTNMCATFYNCKSLTSLDLTRWDARKVTTIGTWNGGMFTFCSSLKSINFGKNFTLENVTDFYNNSNGFFRGCSSLEELDLNMFNTSKVTNMSSMFAACSNLTEIKFGKNFDTSKVTNMAGMFDGCSSLTSLDLTKWDTSSLTGSLWAMFKSCSSLKEIKGIENFNTSNVTGMEGMFNSCSSLEYLDLSNWDTRSVTSINHYNTGGSIFQNCTNLKSIKFGENCTFEKLTYMRDMFRNCTNLSEIVGLEYFNTSIATDMGGMFDGCSSLTSLDLTSFDISNITNLGNMFRGCTNLKEVKVKGNKWNELKSTSGFSGEFIHVEN